MDLRPFAVLVGTAALALMLLSCRRGEWREFSSVDGRYRVSTPAEPIERRTTNESPFGSIEIRTATVESGESILTVSWIDYPESVLRRARADDFLDGARTGVMASSQSTLLWEEPWQVDGNPGRQLELESPDRELVNRMRLLVVRNRVYSISAVTPRRASPADAVRFVESFTLTP